MNVEFGDGKGERGESLQVRDTEAIESNEPELSGEQEEKPELSLFAPQQTVLGLLGVGWGPSSAANRASISPRRVVYSYSYS